jgi:hexulose-6-phosphate isomerase
MITYGIMQGRLTPSKGRGIQFFPFDNWKNEFYEGAKLSLDEIEWIFDFDDYQKNPLWSDEGCNHLRQIIGETGVKVHSVCFDYFMRRPFFKHERDSEYVLKENQWILKNVIDHMEKVGAELIEIPLVDSSAVKTESEEIQVISFIREAADYANDKGILIGLETDFPPGRFRDFLKEIKRSNVYANYDSGNSSGLGYDHEEEIMSLHELIANVHIKDRKLHGTTMALGTGNADFDKVFSSLRAVGYGKAIILQAARTDDGTEKENISGQLSFVKKYVEEYGLT